MSNVAILVGNANYLPPLAKLDCCGDDAYAIKELLEATEKYSTIEILLDVNAQRLKERIRNFVDAHKQAEEVFFYFSGHGLQTEADFFYCPTDFDSKRPNESGLSNSELQMLLRSMEAGLVVKVIDACNSGALLIKSEGTLAHVNKEGFEKFLQFASCLDSQNSITGDPISEFTENFRAAALRKSDGIVYYSDIVEVLRDKYLDNNDRTPHFITQGTGREQFVEDATLLAELRAKVAGPTQVVVLPDATPTVAQTPSLIDILEQAEQRLGTPAIAQTFVGRFFNDIAAELKRDQPHSELFDLTSVEHGDFREDTARGFIIRVLAKEKRPDNFVTATITREKRRRNPYNLNALAAVFGTIEEDIEHYDLTLNCEMEKVQLKITLTPKYKALKQLRLVVSCAPSLETCHIFEMLTRHSLHDWNKFDDEGTEVVRRWYPRLWTEDLAPVVAKICDSLRAEIRSMAIAASTPPANESA